VFGGLNSVIKISITNLTGGFLPCDRME
jgi:hypothetical protein